MSGIPDATKAYLRENDIVGLMDAMAHSLLDSKPDDVNKHLVSYLQQQQAAPAAPAAPSAPAPPAPKAGGPPPPPGGKGAPPPPPPPPSAEFMANLKKKAGGANVCVAVAKQSSSVHLIAHRTRTSGHVRRSSPTSRRARTSRRV